MKDLGNILPCKTHCFKFKMCFFFLLMHTHLCISNVHININTIAPCSLHTLSQMHACVMLARKSSVFFMEETHAYALCMWSCVLCKCSPMTLLWDCCMSGFGGGLCLGIFTYERDVTWYSENLGWSLAVLSDLVCYCFMILYLKKKRKKENQLCHCLLIEIASCWQEMFRVLGFLTNGIPPFSMSAKW
jgi:hypothetical protein